MGQKIKKYFSIFNRLNKKWLFLAFLLFIIFGLFFTFQPALAQIGGLSCGYFDLECKLANYFFSIIIKIVVLVVFAIPLMTSAFVVGIVALILGWIISPDFISISFTNTTLNTPGYNAFVDTGLKITKGFANMGFILFLVVIALATILRIEEYKAKKTLPTLILIALLINFGPVLCGVVIDFTNIVMNFFLGGITGISGFANLVMNAANSIWNSLWNSGLDLWANIAAAMQVIIGIAFNWFAAFIFILFCALFIMRYIMLWILVILSPIAFVSYILPMTRRGQSLLNWRKWWEQLIAWSIIGIIAGFFLYLGFTMIVLINNNSSAFVTQPAIGQLGLMNNILPYLIPLVLLWVAYKETKRTSAMFAGEIISTAEKIGKTAVTAAAMVATAGASATMGLAKGAAKGAPGAVGGFQKRMDAYATSPEHQGTAGGRLAGWMSRRAGSIRGKQIDEETHKEESAGIVGTVREKAGTIAAGAKKEYGEIKEGTREWIESQKNLHPDATAIIGWTKKQAEKSLRTVITGREEKESRELTQDEVDRGEIGKMVTKREKRDITPEENEKYKKGEEITLVGGIKRKLTEHEIEEGQVMDKKEEWQKERDLTEKEKNQVDKEGKRHEIETVTKPGIMPIFKNAMKTAVKGLDDAIQEELQDRLTTLSAKLTKDLKQIKDLQRKIENGEDINFEDDIKGLKEVEKVYKNFHGDANIAFSALNEEVKTEIEKSAEVLKEKAEEEQVGLPRFKISDYIKIPRRNKKKNEPRPPTPTPPPVGPGPEETGEGDSSGGVSPDETGEGDSSGGVSPDETG